MEHAAADPNGAATDQGVRQDRRTDRARLADLDGVAEKLNSAANAFDVQARFSVHKTTGQIMVKIINTRTGRVLREIPPERLVALADSMERMLGLVVDEKA